MQRITGLFATALLAGALALPGAVLAAENGGTGANGGVGTGTAGGASANTGANVTGGMAKTGGTSNMTAGAANGAEAGNTGGTANMTVGAANGAEAGTTGGTANMTAGTANGGEAGNTGGTTANNLVGVPSQGDVNPTLTGRGAALVIAPSGVREVQKALNQLGYLAGTPSGSWDKATQAAMAKFQATHGLSANGNLTINAIAGLGLWDKLIGNPNGNGNKPMAATATASNTKTSAKTNTKAGTGQADAAAGGARR